MIPELEVSIDDYSVVASGLIMVPPASETVKVKISNLTFSFCFSADGGEKSIYLKGGGRDLNINFKNYKPGDSAGRSKSFLKVATYKGLDLSLIYRARFNKNGSRDLSYTFVTTPKDLVEGEGEASDD